MPRVKSDVWRVFIKTNIGGICKLCQCEVKSAEGTTNLRKHLTRRHSKFDLDSQVNKKEASRSLGSSTVVEKDEELVDDLTNSTNCEISDVNIPESDSEISQCSTITSLSEEVGATSKPETPNTPKRPPATPSKKLSQQRISDAFEEIDSFTGGQRCAKITNAITFFIAKDNLPLNTTDKEGFKYLMNTAVPHFKIPGRKSVTNLIDQKYEVLSAFIKNKLIQVNNMTLSTDIWTETMNTTSFLSLTVHFYFENKLNSISLCVLELTERHTGQYIGECLRSLCEEWNIELNKVTAVVTDNGSNIVKAVSDVFGRNKSLPCFAHTLDLVASKIIDDTECVKNVIDKVKRIVMYFKQSVVAADLLRKAQNTNTDIPLKLIQSVPTRWNSVFYMIDRFLHLSGFLAPILLDNRNAPTMIDATELVVIREIVQILKPIEEVSKEICGEQYLTASKIIPIVNCLSKKIAEFVPSTEIAKKLNTATMNELKKRFGAVEQVQLLAVSTLLDPRFKKLHFNNIIACSEAIKYISDLCKEDTSKVKIPDKESKIPMDSDSVWSYHQQLINQSDSTNEEDLDEGIYPDLRTYLKEAPLPLNADVLLYWKNALVSNTLKNVALKHLSIVGTSVPSERLFSKAGATITPSRNRLLGKRLSKLLFLNSLDFEDWNL